MSIGLFTSSTSFTLQSQIATCCTYDPQHALILHAHKPSKPRARRSAEPARPSDIPTLNAPLLNTEAAVVGALLVPDELPDDDEVAEDVMVEPGAVVPDGVTVGLKYLMFSSRSDETLRN